MRKDAREAAFKIVFASLFQADTNAKFQADVFRKDKLNEEDRAFAKRLVELVLQHEDELKTQLNETGKRFPEERIYPADRAALLVALAEIKYCDDVPPVVSVDEAVRIVQKYSTENSASFVNGVLAEVIKK